MKKFHPVVNHSLLQGPLAARRKWLTCITTWTDARDKKNSALAVSLNFHRRFGLIAAILFCSLSADAGAASAIQYSWHQGKLPIHTTPGDVSTIGTVAYGDMVELLDTEDQLPSPVEMTCYPDERQEGSPTHYQLLGHWAKIRFDTDKVGYVQNVFLSRLQAPVRCSTDECGTNNSEITSTLMRPLLGEALAQKQKTTRRRVGKDEDGQPMYEHSTKNRFQYVNGHYITVKERDGEYFSSTRRTFVLPGLNFNEGWLLAKFLWWPYDLTSNCEQIGRNHLRFSRQGEVLNKLDLQKRNNVIHITTFDQVN